MIVNQTSEHSHTSLSVIVGVSGGIAAYKAAHLVRFFKEQGHDVRVIPTDAALNFVGAATFEALSGNPVDTHVFEAVDEVQHVRLGQEADLIVIAPATADCMARIAQGRADDLLTASVLVATCPVVLAPAMHTEMWLNPATQDNVATLRRHGKIVLEPAHGRLTGADSGPGRMPEPAHIGRLAEAVVDNPEVFRRDLEGTRVLISAGGTHEALDPVRFLGNASSGKQGFALADVAAQRGAEVTIVAGVTEDLDVPSGADIIRVRSALEMKEAMDARAQDADVVIMAAAVADYRPASVAEAKLKKGSETALDTLELVENPDILAGLVQARHDGQISASTAIVGFAAETGDDSASPLDHGIAKFQRKGCDLLMCNAVGDGKVFGQDHSQGWIISRGEEDTGSAPHVVEVDAGTKLHVAARIWDEIHRLTGA
ncbi:bifunctional phosphopantothenoylcysteine decarboxylase/phosphopantothenate--cysteine ligase CoaBC [Corynebacterium sp. zg254]|uniref:Coenzyme A biosynthesis bifunctional protein CoaBC n=1 Tax=Corynebacterium zhongnanshanii TaxID=2768834 RepID=A0ABQ6VLX9_9CORY|nr:bifunctional phosphopantothenoylcysteine decarboxylase/phosphopantothenate--cysteine ligase CoaBC [Corynebacterium zhongnanshanii]MCR5913403.1 bifunctional phosphopantothenoylcysteine decarboxylase/phosphopantothenate--cysteine ligase CoaBC [Corynebacterium sp. zg254]